MLKHFSPSMLCYAGLPALFNDVCDTRFLSTNYTISSGFCCVAEGAGKVAKGDMFKIGNQDLDDDHLYKRVTI